MELGKEIKGRLGPMNVDNAFHIVNDPTAPDTVLSVGSAHAALFDVPLDYAPSVSHDNTVTLTGVRSTPCRTTILLFKH